MVGTVEYDQLVKYIWTWTCYSSVPQSAMVREFELQKQRLGLFAIMEFLVGILFKDILGSNGMFEEPLYNRVTNRLWIG